MQMRKLIGVLLVISVLLAGCQAAEVEEKQHAPSESGEGQDQPAATPETTNPTPDPSPASVDPVEDIPAPRRGEEYIVSLAVSDLSERLEISKDEIQVVSVETVEWPDSSLGCPQDGMAYAQVMTPGYEIILQADGEEYRYHSDKEQFMILCGEGDTMEILLIPIQPGDKIQDGSPWVPVD